ncbi:hypothetical protein B0H14DRAFT_2581021 [Mycena olivaceomarginata]|nr:hypothetical protein B0H14DRAFT_2581021 [Mycena olivaceomarginata]
MTSGREACGDSDVYLEDTCTPTLYMSVLGAFCCRRRYSLDSWLHIANVGLGHAQGENCMNKSTGEIHSTTQLFNGLNECSGNQSTDELIQSHQALLQHGGLFDKELVLQTSLTLVQRGGAQHLLYNPESHVFLDVEPTSARRTCSSHTFCH